MELHIKRTASTRALAIPEIVTSIMHQTDMRTLIAAQRVCQKWADLIRTSLSLQKALFLLPDHTSEPSQPRLYNLLLAEIFPSFFPSHVRSDSTQDLNLTSLTFAKSRDALTRFLRREASWRRMLTTQPPIYTLGQFDYGTGMLGLGWKQAKAAPQKEGLRMGTFFEMAIQIDRYDWNSSSIWISLGGEAPVNAPAELIKPSIYLNANGINSDWQRMLGETDLVLATSSHSSCMDIGPDDPDWRKSSDEIVWEEIRACYRDLRIRMSALPMKPYNEGLEMWN